MIRRIAEAVRIRGSLAVDPKTTEGEAAAERAPAWDEDATTLAIEAASHVGHAPLAVVANAIDAEAFRVALDLGQVHVAADPLALARGLQGDILVALPTPEGSGAIAALVREGEGADAAPRDAGAPARMVSALRALAESRRVPPTERMPDSPMGAYVPWGTWVEDLPARLRLIAQKCRSCGHIAFPPRGACPSCRATGSDPLVLPREARVYAATRIGRGGAPSEFALEQAQVGAYWVAVVEWPEVGVRVTARLAGFGDEGPRIGQKVHGVVRRLFDQEGRTRYGLKFRA